MYKIEGLCFKAFGQLAKRLRRLIRNQLGFPRVGSNPALVVVLLPYGKLF